MAFVTKTWKDRLVEFSGRRKLKNVSTNEEIIYDVSRSEGTIMQVGDQFSAENMNNLEQRIKTEFDSVNSSLNDHMNNRIGYPDMTQQIFSNAEATAFTWTATQDCWVYGWCCAKSTYGSAIKLNGVPVILAHGVTNVEIQVGSIFPCKKGDIVSKTINGATTGFITAYAKR